MAASVSSLLGEDATRRIRPPIDQACGLPRQAYTCPEFFALERNLDGSKNGLVPVHLATWQHWVFVNLDAQAPPLEQYLAPLITLTQGYDLSATLLHRRVDWDFNANWKFKNDNWETCHHTWVHEGIFHRMSDDIDLETREPLMQSLQWENVVTLKRRRNPKSRSNIVNPSGARLPPIPRIPGFDDSIGGTSLESRTSPSRWRTITSPRSSPILWRRTARTRSCAPSSSATPQPRRR